MWDINAFQFCAVRLWSNVLCSSSTWDNTILTLYNILRSRILLWGEQSWPSQVQRTEPRIFANSSIHDRMSDSWMLTCLPRWWLAGFQKQMQVWRVAAGCNEIETGEEKAPHHPEEMMKCQWPTEDIRDSEERKAFGISLQILKNHRSRRSPPDTSKHEEEK